MDSEHDKSAESIRSSFKHLFETLMDQTADRIYIKDTASRFVFVSTALAKTHGFGSSRELEGMTDFDFFDQETAQHFYEEEKKVLKTEKPIVNRIEKELWKNGSTTWASVSKSPLYLDSGQAIGIIGVSRDVTEEHLYKERLKEQNRTMLDDYASAEKVQRIMIPGRIPHINGINLAYIWKPLAAVGGDIINFPRNPENKLIFFLADVCGHGVQAAFFTVLLKYVTAQAAETCSDDPKSFLDRVNELITDRMNKGFVTASAGHFDIDRTANEAVLHLSNAGQPDIMIQRASTGKAEIIKLPSAMVLGLTADQSSEPVQYRLKPGDRFFAWTDGIIESCNANGEEFGLERLRAEIEASKDASLEDTLKAAQIAMLEHSRPLAQQDDISLLAFEVTL